MSVAVIIPAAGLGRRMKETINKQYLQLCGKPVVAHTLSACLAANCFTQIIVVVTPGEEELFRRDVVLPWFPAQTFTIVKGGRERQDSVRNGLAVLKDGIDFVCIHDGARPLAQAMLLQQCLVKAKECGAAIAAVPVKDTIKVVDEAGQVVVTPIRSQLWAVQTPQIFRREWVEDVHHRAAEEQIQATDDASLLEQYGFPVSIVKSNYENIKVTTPEDLMLAEAILRRR
ncbi:MAG: 2-C-methyl-D-erythritol 4-phosphate cytidylyltransferase [Firmicutes bacterium]|nr:2-C-methyl-D-erythritol 4-phosphate cytidylyltransferase [Bacillota bacterium]